MEMNTNILKGKVIKQIIEKTELYNSLLIIKFTDKSKLEIRGNYSQINEFSGINSTYTPYITEVIK